MAAATPKERAVVLLSGGLDSAVALACARRDGFSCHALSFDYGQRHRVELEAAARVASGLDAAEHRIVKVDLRSIGGSALTDQIDVPKARTGAEMSAGVPVTYVPARNLIFLSIAVGLAEALGAGDIFLGINAVDYSGYPDCRRPFIDAFIKAANLGTRWGTGPAPTPGPQPGFRIHTPLVELSKAQIIRLGRDLGVDFASTSSCYDPDPQARACGSCDSCQIRRQGFEDAGMPDPTRYARQAVAR